MTLFQLILFVAFINCTEAVINSLERDSIIYEGQGFSYFCYFTQPVNTISLAVNKTTAVHCTSTTNCRPNLPGFFFEPFASNETCMTFYIKNPKEGLYTCMDGNGSRQTDQLTLHKRDTSVENTSDVDTQITTTSSPTTTHRSNDTIQTNASQSMNSTSVNLANHVSLSKGYLILYVSIVAVIMGNI